MNLMTKYQANKYVRSLSEGNWKVEAKQEPLRQTFN